VAFVVNTKTKRFYPSSPFTFTLEQLQWLKKHSNASQVLRWLLERAMSDENFMDMCDALQRVEDQIEHAKSEIKEFDQNISHQKLADLKQKRKKLLSNLL